MRGRWGITIALCALGAACRVAGSAGATRDAAPTPPAEGSNAAAGGAAEEPDAADPFDASGAAAELLGLIGDHKQSDDLAQHVERVSSYLGIDADWMLGQMKRYLSAGLPPDRVVDAIDAAVDVADAVDDLMKGAVFVGYSYVMARGRGAASGDDIDGLSSVGLARPLVLTKLAEVRGVSGSQSSQIEDAERALERGLVTPSQLLAAAIKAVIVRYDDGKAIGSAALERRRRCVPPSCPARP